MDFYGCENVPEEVLVLYRKLLSCWCRETCAARLRDDWSEENPSLGQCSISSFLVQDILGGDVLGVPIGGGMIHCFNEVNGVRFDLTSGQFCGKPVDYESATIQRREEHFKDPSKLERYELLKELFYKLEN